jgi:two-component system cell cycle sensor histidine kinase/response regulator CckA
MELRRLAGHAHDFNNNLAIIGYVDMIPGQIGHDKPIRAISKSAACGRALAGFVRRLAFGRRQDSAARLLSLAIEGLKPLLERLIGESIQVAVARSTSDRSSDAGQVEQVIMNLSLARDAMPSGGTLTIVTRNARG